VTHSLFTIISVCSGSVYSGDYMQPVVDWRWWTWLDSSVIMKFLQKLTLNSTRRDNEGLFVYISGHTDPSSSAFLNLLCSC